MRPLIPIAAIAVLGVAAGGAYYGLEVYPQRQFRKNLDQTLATLPAGTTAAYKDAHYSVLSHKATLTGLALRSPAPDDPTKQIELSIESMEVTNPNLDSGDGWARVAAGPAAPDVAVPLADGILATGVRLRGATLDMTMDSVRVDKSRVYPWRLLHDAVPAWRDILAALEVKTTPPTPDDLLPLLRAEAVMMSAAAYDSYATGPMKMTIALPDGVLAYDIRSTVGGAFDRGVMGGGTIEGITIKNDKLGTFTVDRATLGATDFRQPMARLLNGEALSITLLDGITIGRIDYAGITAQPPGEPPIHAGGFAIGPITFSKGLLSSMAFSWNDFAIARDQISNVNVQDTFDKLGLTTMTTSFNLIYEWDAAGKRAVLRDTTLTVKELGTMTLSAEVTNLAPGLLGLAQGELVHARLTLRDGSLADRLLTMGAKQSGADPAAFRKQTIALVRMQTKAGGPPLAAAGDAVGAFLEAPRSLTIELAPAAPVPFTALQTGAAAPGALAKTLGLAVTANQP